jgi:diguanylate cyclase (GGDEF)-like protein
MPRSRTYPILGTLLALGVVLGLPVVDTLRAGRLPTARLALADIAQLWVSYAYLTLSSLAVVITLGYLLGRWHDRAQLLSFTDPLTGLFNRRYFSERMSADLTRARLSGCSICVLCIDLDHLKSINDGLGHQAGDDALVSVARTIVKNLRPTDVVARFGGDEFVVLLPETSVVEASTLSERIVGQVSRLGQVSTGQIDVSIGVAALNVHADPKDMLAAADEALYRAKATGGGHTAIARSVQPLDGESTHKPPALNRRARDLGPSQAKTSRPAGKLRCAACQSEKDVSSQDELGELAFCAVCLRGARPPVPEAEPTGDY